MNWDRFRNVIESNETRTGRAFDLTIQCLIVLSLISYAVETLPDLHDETRRFLKHFETMTIAIFCVEYALRLLVAERRIRFIFSFYGLVDAAAIFPFFLASGIDARSIRVLRLFRLVRAFKLIRYSAAMRRFSVAFRIAREELVLYAAFTLMMLYLAAVGIYHFEHDAQPEAFASVFHAFWWAVVTLTTVGYGDSYPITIGGRVFTFFILMLGLGIVAVPSGLLATALGEARRRLDKERAAAP